LNKWKKTYGDKINLSVIYISEAHADDEWPISQGIQIKQTQTVKERIDVVKYYLKDRLFDVYVDDALKENFEYHYAGWPERAFIIVKGKIEYISYVKVNDLISWRKEIEEWLKANFTK